MGRPAPQGGGVAPLPGSPRPGPSRLILHKSQKFSDLRRYPWLKPYRLLIRDFLFYLASINGVTFLLEGMAFTPEGCQDVSKTFPYPCRWTEPRRKATLAKLYQLEEWHKASGLPACMMTLTTYHDWQMPHHGYQAKKVREGYSIEKSFELLNVGWDKLSKVMRYHLGKFDYFWTLEPHAMGYPHRHVLLFCEPSDQAQEKIRDTWTKRYGIASSGYGVDFSFNPIKGELKSVRNYLMKYLAKNFDTREMTPCQLAFNALLWKHDYRLTGASRGLTRVMKYQPKTWSNVEWTSTYLVDQDQEKHELWRLPLATE